MKTLGKIFDIKRFAIHDGPGIRTTIFFKGCPLRCGWCHNPEALAEQTGREIDVDELMAEVLKDALFYDQSGGGITFSGGEPLLQPDFLLKMIDACREKDIHTAIDTTGFAGGRIFQKVLQGIDLFLYDLKIMDGKRHEEELGVSNRPILANLKRLDQAQKPTYIRFPVIPGFTDSDQNLKEMAQLVRSLTCVEKINLLPYHRTAAHKYERLHMPHRLAGLQPPSGEDLKRIEKILISQGITIPIQING